MKRFLLQNALIVLIGMTAFLAKAQETTQPATVETTTAAAAANTPEVESTSSLPFDIGGFVDAYYAYNFNEKPFTTSFTNAHNSFSLGMANLVLSKTADKFGFVADLAFGPRAEGANGYVDANGKISSLTLIKQLYVTYAPAEWVTLTLGNFSTFVGYELIDSPLNLNYSTSYMFTNGPFFHTGLKANFKLSEKFGALVGIFNDTDTKIDVVSGKHLGGQVSYNDGKLALYLNYLDGRHSEGFDSVSSVFSRQLDLTGTLALGKVGVGLNVTNRIFDPEESGSANSWFGTALYVNFPVSEMSKIALRGEYISDNDGIITGVADNSIVAFTLSGNIKAGPFIFIPEFRIDTSAEEGYFTDENGKGTKSNAGVIFAVIYDF